MKTKAMILSSLLAVSTVSMAQGGFPNGGQEQPPQGRPEMCKEMHRMNKPAGGYFDESLAVKTAADAQKASDNTPVLIVGSIVKQIDRNEFIFKDTAGTEVQIKVGKHAWDGQTILPTDKIELRGKVDKEWNKTEIKVKQITKK